LGLRVLGDDGELVEHVPGGDQAALIRRVE